jgi:hypothetical protein
MKAIRQAVALLLCMVCFAAGAAPFVVATVVSGVSSCGVFLDAAAKVTVTATALQCKYDLAAVSVGAHTVTMTAISTTDPVWGTQESAQSAPLNFTRPALPAVPSGLTLTP